MKHSDFKVGVEFKTAGGRWRCTDIGTRTIIAIQLWGVDNNGKKMDETWFRGPPYAVKEHVLDEYDLEGCSE